MANSLKVKKCCGKPCTRVYSQKKLKAPHSTVFAQMQRKRKKAERITNKAGTVGVEGGRRKEERGMSSRQKPSHPVHEISSRSLRRTTTTTAKQYAYSLRMDRFFITWDHRLLTGPFVKEVSSKVESEFEKDDRHASLQQVDPMAISMLSPRSEPNEPRQIPYKLKWRRMHNPVYSFDLRLAQTQWMRNLSRPSTASPYCMIRCWRIAKRNLHDTEAEILFEKQNLKRI